MGLLNLTNDGLPSVLVVLWRTVLRAGPQRQEILFQLCAPETLCDQKMARATLRRWTDLGLFLDQDGEISLASPFDSLELDPPDVPLYSAFRAAALALLLCADNNPDSNSGAEGIAQDLVEGLCWLLAQDPFQHPLSTHPDVDALTASQDLPVLQNDTRWRGLREWGLFLGLVESLGGSFKNQTVPDPTVAISPRLPELFREESFLLQDVFLERLGRVLPVLDGGHIRLKAETSWGDKVRLPAKNELSVSLSMALLRLEEEGLIKMKSESDGVTKALTGPSGAEISQFTEVHFTGGAR